jgi:hypothetical protein
MAAPGFVLGGGNVARRDSPDAREFAGRMLSIHSENCRNSISRREKSYLGPGGNVPGQIRPEVPRQPAFIVTKHFVRLIASRYLLTGFDLDKRLDPVFPPRSLAMGMPVADHSRSDTTIMHCKDDFSDHMTLGEALMRLGGPGEGIAFGDGNPEPGGLHCRVEALEFANA